MSRGHLYQGAGAAWPLPATAVSPPLRLPVPSPGSTLGTGVGEETGRLEGPRGSPFPSSLRLPKGWFWKVILSCVWALCGLRKGGQQMNTQTHMQPRHPCPQPDLGGILACCRPGALCRVGTQ